VTREQLPGGLGWSLEFVHLTTHSGTHLDAPWHYHPTMDGGRRAMTIDEIPLEWWHGRWGRPRFPSQADGERITVADIRKALERIRYEVKPLDIVLIQTGADAAWGKPEYLVKGPRHGAGEHPLAARERRKSCRRRRLELDRPLPYLAEEFRQTGDARVIWEAHFAGIDIGYCQAWRKWRTWLPSVGPTGSPCAASPSGQGGERGVVQACGHRRRQGIGFGTRVSGFGYREGRRFYL